MFSIVFIIVMASTFVAAMAAGAVIGLLLALAGSVGGALVGAVLHWSDTAIGCFQLAGPLLLLVGLIGDRLLDRLARHAEFRRRRQPARDSWPSA
jgi:hypothetical protein